MLPAQGTTSKHPAFHPTGGFGSRGVEGKIAAANYARTAKVPYLGICLGMQLAVVEFARNVVGLAGANSTEFESVSHSLFSLRALDGCISGCHETRW